MGWKRFCVGFAGILVSLLAGSLAGAPVVPSSEPPLSRERRLAQDSLRALRALAADPTASPAEIWRVAQAFPLHSPGTPECVQAAAVLSETPSPLDRLARSREGTADNLPWVPADVVAILGDQRGRHWENVNSLFTTPDGKLLLTQAGEGLRVWDVQTLRERRFIPGATAAAVSRDGRWLAVALYRKSPELSVKDGRYSSELQVYSVTEAGWVLKGSVVRKGHYICTLAFSPDGRSLASGGVGDFIVRVARRRVWGKQLIWDLTGERPRLRAEIDIKPPNSCWSGFLEGGTRLVVDAGSKDGQVRVWDLRGSTPQVLTELHGTKWGGAISPDGRYLALPTAQGNAVRLWDAAGGNLRRLPDVSCPGWNPPWLAFSPDGELLGLNSDQTLHLFPLTAGKRKALGLPAGVSVRKVPLPFPAYYPCFLPDNRTVALSGNKSIRLFDLDSGTEKPVSRARSSPVLGCAFSPNAMTLASGGGRPLVRLWALGGVAPVERGGFDHEGWSVTSLSFAPDGNTLLAHCRITDEAASDPATVALWDLSKPETPARTFQPHAESYDVHFGLGGRSLLTVGCEGRVGEDGGSYQYLARLWSPDRWPPRRLMEISLNGPDPDLEPNGRDLRAVRLSPDGRLLVGLNHSTLHLWDLTGAAPREVASREPPQNRRLRNWESIEAVDFSPDGGLLASAGLEDRATEPMVLNQVVKLWDIRRKTFAPAGVLDASPHPEAKLLAFSPDGTLLASAARDGTLLVWDVGSRRRLRTWKLPSEPRMLTFAPDSRHLATANPNGTTYIFRVRPPSR